MLRRQRGAVVVVAVQVPTVSIGGGRRPLVRTRDAQGMPFDRLAVCAFCKRGVECSVVG